MKKLLLGLASVLIAGACYATTYSNLMVGSGAALASGTAAKLHVISGEVKVSSTNSYASGDVVRVLYVPSNSYVLAVCYATTTLFTNADLTADFGNADNSAIWQSNYSLTTTVASVYDTSGAAFQEDDNDVRVEFDAASGNTGAIKVQAVIMNLR